MEDINDPKVIEKYKQMERDCRIRTAWLMEQDRLRLTTPGLATHVVVDIIALCVMVCGLPPMVWSIGIGEGWWSMVCLGMLPVAVGGLIFYVNMKIWDGWT